MPNWLNSLIFNAPKHVWKTIERVLISMFTTKATVPLGAMVAICWIVSKMSSADIKEIAVHAFDTAWVTALGWIMFLLSIIVGTFIFKWREQIYQRELDRIQGVKDQLLKGQLELKLQTEPTRS